MDNLQFYGVSPSLQFWAYAVLVLPLAAFLLNGLWLGRRNARTAAAVATILIGFSFVAALALAVGWRDEILYRPTLFPAGAALAFDYAWLPFPAPRFAADFGYYLDALSVAMTCIVTGISFLVHLYSVGYMREDRSAGRFFALLPFFTFTMLGLVAAHNIVQTFFFWELVGAASYLLIGFWYEKPSAVAASKKAFILTRLADAFFLAGLLLAGLNAQSFDFSHLTTAATAEVLNRAVGFGGVSVNLLFIVTIFLYAGAWGKSALFPLHVWLPDAMEGPTPVSALIHSATMVVAGVYLTARLFPLFAACPATLHVVELTGVVTAAFAALVACAQTDLKRILAFSTLSQIGYMMFALGVAQPGDATAAGYSASLFHVFTHAFFKCLLFLSAGMVIHAVHGQELKDAGGLRKRLPWTYLVTLIACLAISGVWPFSGFFSKDAILMAALANGHRLTFAVGLATGGLTAFYMFRYFFLVFHGPQSDHAPRGHDAYHEPVVMVLPMLALAVFSVLGGAAKSWYFDCVRPFPAPPWFGQTPPIPAGHGWLPYAALCMAALGIAAAYVLYVQRRLEPGETATSPLWYRWMARKFYLDAVWLYVGRRVGLRGMAQPLATVERRVVNGAFDGGTWLVRSAAWVVRTFQNGRLQFYSALGLLGLCVFYWVEGVGR